MDWFWLGLIVGLVLVVGGSITLFLAREIKGDTLRIVVGIIGAIIAGFGGLVTTSAWSYRSGENQKGRFEASIAKNREMITDMVNESIEKQRHLMAEEKEARKHALLWAVTMEAQTNYYYLNTDFYKTGGTVKDDQPFPPLHSEAMKSALISGLFFGDADPTLYDRLFRTYLTVGEFNQKTTSFNTVLLHLPDPESRLRERKKVSTEGNLVMDVTNRHIELIKVLKEHYGPILHTGLDPLMKSMTERPTTVQPTRQPPGPPLDK